jgi:peptidoglycan/xylan/chitin deacetylase (PgdA/CDA1 family)
MRGHLYCSSRCAGDDGRHAVWRAVRGVLARPVPARLAVAVVMLAAAAPVILALKTVRELDRLNASTPLARPRREAPSARLDSVVETPGGAVLEGTASEASAVFLFAAGRFVGSVPSAKGRFRFEGVREPGPYRVGALSLSGEAPIGAAETSIPAANSAPAPAAAPPAPAPASTLWPTPRALPRPAVSAPLPPGGPAAPDVTRGPADRREVVVSFDGGSSDRGAGAILDALARRGIRTTIFLTGEFIRRYPDVVRRVAADGHEVGNHTDTHPHLTTYAADGRQSTRPGVSRDFLAGELARTARLYREATGREMAPAWRAPFGEHNAEIRRWAAEQGYWHVGWTGGRFGLDGMDWVSDPRSRAYQPAPLLLSRLVGRVENGGIVLLHLGSDREEPVAARIDVLLDGLHQRGFRFARATEFLQRQGYDADRLALYRTGASAAAH